MTQLLFAKPQAEDLKPFVEIQEQGIGEYAWLRFDTADLTQDEQQQIIRLKTRLLQERTLLMNEATVWARAGLIRHMPW